MTGYELYVFILCLIVFIMLTALSVVCVTIIARLSLRLINAGLEDENILKEHRKEQKNKKLKKYLKFADYAFSGIICLLFVAMFLFSVAIRCDSFDFCDALPSFHVVRSNSMETKNHKNAYLFTNQLDDQIQMFDLVRIEKLPDERSIELYDIVVYQHEGTSIMHRIVEIEESNEFHPGCRYFYTQGDAIDVGDKYPVLYEQMQGIYRGQRTPYIGSFIMFMQSPAGWLCTLLIVITMIAAPLLDKKLTKARKKRLQFYLENYADNANEADSADDSDKAALKTIISTGGRDD
ncbi:MAG: hypothetical protein E7488_03845 [Ruminococcaceae bacterium]|nr:hypothetical protein [Oscillospiraceae bacterium]